MKRLLLLTALTMMPIGLAGCRCCDWLWRGAAYTPAPAATGVMMADPGNPCDPCPTGVPMSGACAPVVPGPGG